MYLHTYLVVYIYTKLSRTVDSSSRTPTNQEIFAITQHKYYRPFYYGPSTMPPNNGCKLTKDWRSVHYCQKYLDSHVLSSHRVEDLREELSIYLYFITNSLAKQPVCLVQMITCCADWIVYILAEKKEKWKIPDFFLIILFTLFSYIHAMKINNIQITAKIF